MPVQGSGLPEVEQVAAEAWPPLADVLHRQVVVGGAARQLVGQRSAVLPVVEEAMGRPGHLGVPARKGGVPGVGEALPQSVPVGAEVLQVEAAVVGVAQAAPLARVVGRHGAQGALAPPAEDRPEGGGLGVEDHSAGLFTGRQALGVGVGGCRVEQAVAEGVGVSGAHRGVQEALLNVAEVGGLHARQGGGSGFGEVADCQKSRGGGQDHG